MSKQNEQVVSVLVRAIQTVISQGISDPRVRGMITVTDLKVSGDMANATVLVSVLPEKHADLTLHGLRHAAKHIRHQVSEKVKLRRIPHLSFRLDKSLKKQSEVIAALNRIAAENETQAPGVEATHEDEAT